MRTVSIAIPVLAVALVALPESASANLALQLNPNATISALSAQLLERPRSQAGNRKNCWDADPLVAAEQGFHYFAYNIDENVRPLVPGLRAITLQSADMGPNYFGGVQVLVRSLESEGGTFFMNPDKGTGEFDYSGVEELGLARVNFALDGTPGQIVEEGDVELDYDMRGLDGSPSNERGFEQVRFRTEYLGTNGSLDDRVARGLMTAVVPASFDQFAPGGDAFETGFLDFGDGNISRGENVFSAMVQTPEPAALALLVSAGVVTMRRARRASACAKAGGN